MEAASVAVISVPAFRIRCDRCFALRASVPESDADDGLARRCFAASYAITSVVCFRSCCLLEAYFDK